MTARDELYLSGNVHLLNVENWMKFNLLMTYWSLVIFILYIKSYLNVFN